MSASSIASFFRASNWTQEVLMMVRAFGLMLLLSTVVFAQGAPSPQELAPPKTGAPVVFKDQSLFTVNTRVGSFTPEARAKAISERLERVVSDPFKPIPQLQVVPQEHSTDVICGESILLSLTDEDAKAEGLTRDELAKRRVEVITQALQAQTWVAKLKSLALSVLWTLLATAGGFVVFRGLTALFRRVQGRIQAIPEGSFLAIRIQNLEVVAPQRMRQLTGKAIGLTKVLLLLVSGYAYLSLIFSFFPATRGLAEKLFHLASGPLGRVWDSVLGYLPNLFFLLLIAVLTRYLLKLIHLIFKGIGSEALTVPGFHPDWAEPTYRLSRILAFAFALIVAFPYLPGSGSEAFKGVSLFLGVLFSLGSTGIVGNVVAGIMITYMRPFKLGDRIAVGDTVGDVVEKSLLVTRIRTIKNVDVTIPNSTLLGAQVQNFSANAMDRGLILHTTVTIGYDAPWRTVHGLLISAAQATEGILRDPAPFVLQTSLDDFYVSYQINAYTREASRQAALYSELHANIQEKFNEAGVEIMSPHYRAERDGNQTTIPADYLPKDYVAPSFRIERTNPEA